METQTKKLDSKTLILRELSLSLSISLRKLTGATKIINKHETSFYLVLSFSTTSAITFYSCSHSLSMRYFPKVTTGAGKQRKTRGLRQTHALVAAN
jgi:hypothetical protein